MMSRPDALIVGGGTAGAILAARLSEDPARRVLLLEAGRDYASLEAVPRAIRYSYFTASARLTGSEFDWGLTAAANTRGDRVPLPRGRGLGGSSAINAQMFLRPPRADFDRWAAIAPSWSHREVLPFYRTIERDLDFDGPEHGSDGPITVSRFAEEQLAPEQRAFREACAALGFERIEDLNGTDRPGVGRVPFNDASGERISTAIGYLLPVRHRANLEVRGDARVERLVIESGRARAVVLESGERIEAAEIVSAAGVIGSPELLLRSGISAGEGLIDHPMVALGWSAAAGVERVMVPTGAQMMLRLPEAQILCCSFETKAVSRGVFTGNPRGIGMTVTLLESESRGSVAIRDGRTEIRLEHFAVEADRRRLREAVRVALAIAEQPAFAELLGEPVHPEMADDAALDAFLDRASATGHHLLGTCAMGAVVDERGLVRGVEGLRVVDASIVPVCLRANTAASVMMIAERIAGL